MSSTNKSKIIAKNTFFLYIRMFILMFISLFTARVLLDKLGVEDYGIYNVVGGLAGMFTFFSSSLANASQRFLNIELGTGLINNAKNIFSQHFTLYIVICVGVVVISETIGLWFVYNKLVIEETRLYAALWVYQFMVISLCVTLIGIIFNSAIIAHEQMNVYSFVGIFEGVSKLLICYLLSISNFDKLILYGFLLLVVTLVTQAYFAYYSLKHYEECKLRFLWNKKILKETSSIIGWNTIGTLVYAINDAGVNIMLNLFFGPIVNAARAISFQISTSLNNFSTNFFVSVRPQITKSYATRDFDYLLKLFYGSSKYSFYLLWIFSLPIMLAIDAILKFWLKVVPQYTSDFTIWVLIYSLINVLNNPVWSVALSVGKLKRYIGVGSLIFFMVFPISYIALYIGFSPVSIFIVMVVVRSVYLIVVLSIIKRFIPFSVNEYLRFVIYPILKVIVLTIFISYVLRIFLNGNILITIIFCLISIISTAISIWFCGINNEEKFFILSSLKEKFKK